MGEQLHHASLVDAAGKPLLACANDVLALGDPREPRRYVGFTDVPGAPDGARFHLKRYRYTTWRESLGLLGRGTLWGQAPELAEYEALQMLAKHGIPAVRPAAACAVTRFGRLVAHALLTHAAPPDAIALETRIRATDDPVLGDRTQRRALLRHLGGVIGTMHALSFIHRDLRARNVLVGPPGPEGPPIWLLDCRKGGPGSGEDRLVDLAAFDRDLIDRVPRSDRYAALRAYVGAAGGAKSLVAAIARRREAVRPPRAL